MKVLQIIHCAYRATTEEQDDTVVWITHAMRGAGGELDVLLRGNAANYVVKTQNAEGLSFGDWQQTQPPRLARDISGLIGKDVYVYVLEEDLKDRGLENVEFVEGIRPIPEADIPNLIGRYDRVWQW